MSNKIIFCLFLSLFGLVLSACVVGPDYDPPQIDMPEKWHEESEGVVVSTSSPLSSWWTLFDDTELDDLISRAVSANKNLKIAESRILEARARRTMTGADAWLGVGSSGMYSRSRRSQNASSSTGSSSIGPNDLFQAGFDAGWEIDLFGKIRRALEAADADTAVAEENRRDVLVTLLSEVAGNYFELRGNQHRIALAHDNIAVLQQTLEMIQGRFAIGLSSRLDLARAKALLAAAESEIPILEAAVRSGAHRLAVLAGMAPSALIDEMEGQGTRLSQPVEVPIDLPSELLRRRPDIRRAERQLAGATAAIGVATAELFPTFSLSALIGLQSNNFSNLVTNGSRYWTIGPSLNWSIFDAGRIRAGIAERRAQQDQALLGYQQQVLTALEEVENALVAYDREKKTRKSLEETVVANQQAMMIADDMYKAGLVDFFNVLDSRRSLILSQDQLIQSKYRVFLHIIALYKALGGGWQVYDKDSGCDAERDDYIRVMRLDNGVTH